MKTKIYYIAITVLSFICSVTLKAQINPLLYKWQGSVSSSWSESQNWQVWNQGTSSWVTNSLATFPNASTYTVTIDFTSAITKTVVLDVATNNADVSEIYIINNSASAGYFKLNNGMQLSVYNTFSVSGTNTNLVNINGVGNYSPYSALFGQIAGGGRITFLPITGTTITPTFANSTVSDINITIAGTGVTTFNETNLSFTSLFHNSGTFNLINKTLNLLTSYQLFSVGAGVYGFSNLSGSIINTQNLLLATNASLNFSALTSTINLNAANTNYAAISIFMNGDNAAASTATISSLNLTGDNPATFAVDYNYFSGTVGCTGNVFIENLSVNCTELQFNPYAASGLVDYKIKHWKLLKPLNIIAHNGANNINFKGIASITTATSTCNSPYHFMGKVNQVDIQTAGSVTVSNMSFFNSKITAGSLTANGGANIGYNTGITFINSPSSFGVNTYTWNGSVNSEWQNSSNWSPSCIPSILDNVIIPSGTPNSLYLKKASAICYHFNTIGSPTIILENTSVPLFVGGNFIRTPNTVMQPGSLGYHGSSAIYLMGILPNTIYNITSNNTLLSHCGITINANHNGSGYQMTDAFSANYPAMNHVPFSFLSGKFITNGFAFDTQAFMVTQNNVATSTRSLNIANSTIRLHNTMSWASHFGVYCNNVNEFNTTNSIIYLKHDNFQPWPSNAISIYNLPSNNHLATPTFSLNRVIIDQSNTIPGRVYVENVNTNFVPASGFKIKSLKALGNLQLLTNNASNFLNMDSLYLSGGYTLLGQSNGSVTINNYINSGSGCATARFSATSTSPGSASGNQFYINTGPSVTYTLSHWDINSVRVNQSTGGLPAITVNEANINSNSGTSPANGWNTTPVTSKTFYWIGEGSTTNWSELNNWSFSIPTNGDDATAGCLPSVYDDVLFTNMSFYGNSLGTVNTSSIVMVDIPSVGFRDMRWMGPFTTSSLGSTPLMPKITTTITDAYMSCYGSLRMHKTMDWNFGKTIPNNSNHVFFNSTTQDTIEIQNNSFWSHIYFYGSGKYIVKDSLVLDGVSDAIGVGFATGKGAIRQLNGELDLQGHKVFAHYLQSGGHGQIGPVKLNISNAKLVFTPMPYGDAGRMLWGSLTANTYTLDATNSHITIHPTENPYAYGHFFEFHTTSSPKLKFNVIKVSPYYPFVNFYQTIKYGTGSILIDSLIFDTNTSSLYNASSPLQPDSINYLKYKVGSTNNLTAGTTIYVNELDAKSACDPITITSGVVGSYANLCPSSTTALQASQVTLNYINSACGSYIAPNYNLLKGNLSAFIPAGSEAASGWNLNTAASPLGFVSNKSAIVNCSQLPLTINASEFNASPTTHTLTWQSANGTFVGTPSNGINYTTFTTTATGVHTLSVLYRAGCSVTDTYTVSTINDVTSSYTSTNVICNGLNNGSFSVTASTGTLSSTYNYFISPGSYTTSVVNGLSPNVYTYSITNTINPGVCKTTGTFTITQPAVLITNATVTSSVACYSGSTGVLNSSPAGGNSGYTYLWTNGVSSYSTQNISAIPAGMYSLTVADSKSCTTTNTLQVQQPSSAVSISSVSNNSVLCFGGTGTATVNASGGTGILNYNFGAGAITSNTTALVANNYTITVKDANNCLATSTLTMTQPSTSLSIQSVITNTVLCFGGMGTTTVNAVGGTGSLNYDFGTGAGTSSTTTLVANNYTVTVADANNCKATTTLQIAEPTSSLSIQSVITNTVLCFGGTGTITVNAAGGTGILNYDFGTGTSPTNTIALVANNYTVTVADANNCLATTTLQITEPTSSLSITGITSNTVLCYGGTGSATINAIGGTGTLSYNFGTGAIISNTTLLVANNYTVTVSDANNCVATTTLQMVEPASGISIATSTQTNASCNTFSTASAQLTAIGGTGSYTYSWAPSSVVSINNTANNLAAGSITATVTDANNCSITHTFIITEPAALISTITNTTQAGCGLANGSATYSVSGGTTGYTYRWITPSTTYTTNATTTNSLSAGINQLTVVDANGCTYTVSTIITNPNAPIIATTASSVNCYGTSTGAITTTVTAGSAVTYSWSNGSSSSTINNLLAGMYILTVKDASNCVSVQPVSIIEPSNGIRLGVGLVNNIYCYGTSTGSASVNTSGGSPAYTYTWLPTGGNASLATNLTAQTYTVLATDNGGCTTNTIITITSLSSAALQVVTESTVGVTCEQKDGMITARVTGGTPAYNYAWNTATSTTETLSNIAEGTYSLVVTDAYGCKDTLEVNLSCKYELVIPQLISANGDGKNDKLEIKAITDYPNNKLEIFNRWGNLVYVKLKYNNEWDGKSNVIPGKDLLPAGTYYVVIDFGDGGVTKPYHGYLQLQY